MFIEEGTDFIGLINNYVKTWTKKYIYYTKKISETKYEVINKDLHVNSVYQQRASQFQYLQ